MGNLSKHTEKYGNQHSFHEKPHDKVVGLPFPMMGGKNDIV